MVLDAHAEGVDEDAKEDELLEEVVVHKLFQVFSAGGQTTRGAIITHLEPVGLLRRDRHLVLVAAHRVEPVGRVEAAVVVVLGQVVGGTVLHLSGLEADLSGQSCGQSRGKRE